MLVLFFDKDAGFLLYELRGVLRNDCAIEGLRLIFEKEGFSPDGAENCTKNCGRWGVRT